MCQTQLGKLQKRLKEVEATGAAVLAVSIDRPEAARKLRQDFNLTFPILSDSKMEVTRAYQMKGERIRIRKRGLDASSRSSESPIRTAVTRRVESPLIMESTAFPRHSSSIARA